MIKKSHRKAFDENLLPKYEEEKAERKLKTVLNLLNRCISNCISVPEGYYLCSRCKAKDIIKINSQAKTYSDDDGNKYFCLIACEKCNGVGYIDFVSNAMKRTKGEKICYNIPLYLLAEPKLEVASIIFYNFYFFYAPFLKQPITPSNAKMLSPGLDSPRITTNFNFNNKHGKVTVDEFIDYFTAYKKEREKRRKFIAKNYFELRNEVWGLTSDAPIPSNKIRCKVCSFPIDITYDGQNDLIKLELCGNCYGFGFQSKRDSTTICHYTSNIKNANYNNKRKMVSAILNKASFTRECFRSYLDNIKYKDKKKVEMVIG